MSEKENSGTIEMKKLIEFLIKNEYKLEGVRNSDYYENGRRFVNNSESIVKFSKFPIDPPYTNKIGNYKNDSSISININYENDFDQENGEKYFKENKLGDEIEYTPKINNEAASSFIKKIVDSNTIGGKRRKTMNQKRGKRSKTMKR